MTVSRKDNFKYAISYIPLVAFFLFFIEKNMTSDNERHIKYGMIFFGLYLVFSIFFRIIWLGWLTPIVLLIYIVISIIFIHKTYNGEDIKIKILDTILEKIKK